MATRSGVNNTPVVAEMGDYNGMATWSVGVEGASPKSRLSHTLGKWERLFTIDPDGDSNLMNLFLALYEAAETHQQARTMVQAMQTTITQFREWHEERFEKEVEDEPAPTPEPTPVPTPTADEVAKARMLLRTQLGKFWGLASEEARQFILQDCLCALREGMSFPEFRDALKAYGTADDYVAACK